MLPRGLDRLTSERVRLRPLLMSDADDHVRRRNDLADGSMRAGYRNTSGCRGLTRPPVRIHGDLSSASKAHLPSGPVSQPTGANSLVSCAGA